MTTYKDWRNDPRLRSTIEYGQGTFGQCTTNIIEPPVSVYASIIDEMAARIEELERKLSVGAVEACSHCAAMNTVYLVPAFLRADKEDYGVKIFQLNDCDWWIGPSLEACKKDYVENYCDAEDIQEDAHELSDEELDRLVFVDCDEDERQTGVKRTFREQLKVEVAKGGAFPRMFASTEF